MPQLNYETTQLANLAGPPVPAAIEPEGAAGALRDLLPALSSREAVTVLARLAEAVPVPVLVTDCGPLLSVIYANAAWHRTRPRPQGRPLAEALETMGENPFLPVLWRASETGEAMELRDFPCPGLIDAQPCLPGDVTMWDWAVLPVLARQRGESRLLIALSDVTERHLRAARLRAAGESRPGRPQEDLTAREMEVAELIASGLRNPVIARKLHISRTTVASHVTRILQKLGFATRSQIAAWVVERRLRET